MKDRTVTRPESDAFMAALWVVLGAANLAVAVAMILSGSITPVIAVNGFWVGIALWRVTHWVGR